VRRALRVTAILPITAAVAILASGRAQAADDDTVAQLKAEVARLKEALEKSQQELAAQKGTAAPAAEATQSANGSSAAAAATDQQQENTSELGKVVVHAPSRLAPLKDVPVSISVVTGPELASEDAFDIGSITKRAANVTWNQGNQRTSSLSIRGVGKIGQNEAQDPSVGVVVDGVNYAFNPLTSSVNFTDLDTVQVTRGPQGTLSGKNNSLGQITVTTRRPSFTPDGEYLLSVGERDTFIGQFAGGGPVIDNLLAFRGTISVE
jgi:outer membrane receptor protein involved in Fe transport